MAGHIIAGLFKDQARGEKVLADLQAAGFATAQISERDHETAPTARAKFSNTIADFFKDHQSTGSDFRDNPMEIGRAEQNAHYFEDGRVRVTVKADARA